MFSDSLCRETGTVLVIVTVTKNTAAENICGQCSRHCTWTLL